MKMQKCVIVFTFLKRPFIIFISVKSFSYLSYTPHVTFPLVGIYIMMELVKKVHKPFITFGATIDVSITSHHFSKS